MQHNAAMKSGEARVSTVERRWWSVSEQEGCVHCFATESRDQYCGYTATHLGPLRQVLRTRHAKKDRWLSTFPALVLGLPRAPFHVPQVTRRCYTNLLRPLVFTYIYSTWRNVQNWTYVRVGLLVNWNRFAEQTTIIVLITGTDLITAGKHSVAVLVYSALKEPATWNCICVNKTKMKGRGGRNKGRNMTGIGK
jgi:hypothetical protein